MCHMPGDKVFGGKKYESGVVQACETAIYEKMDNYNKIAYEQALEA